MIDFIYGLLSGVTLTAYAFVAVPSILTERRLRRAREQHDADRLKAWLATLRPVKGEIDFEGGSDFEGIE